MQAFGLPVLGLVPIALLTQDADGGIGRVVYVASTVSLGACAVFGVLVAATQHPQKLIPPYLRREE
jgi:hypothetical protein